MRQRAFRREAGAIERERGEGKDHCYFANFGAKRRMTDMSGARQVPVTGIRLVTGEATGTSPKPCR